MASRCPRCGQHVVDSERVGIRLTPLKAAIFDAIKLAGEVGITSTEILAGPIYRDRRQTSHDTVKAHVWQINLELEATPWVIVSDRRRWFLQKRGKQRRAA